MTSGQFLTAGIALAVLLFGNGLVNKVLIRSLKEELRSLFETKEDARRERELLKAAIERLHGSDKILFQKTDKHHDDLIRMEGVEKRLSDPISQITRRLHQMDRRNTQRDLLIDRTVNTLSQVADTVQKIEERMESRFPHQTGN